MRRRINRERKPAKMRGGKAKTSKRRDASNTRRDRSRANAGDAADEALSSREQEPRLLVETIPALVSRTGPAGNVEFTAQLQAILNVLPAYTWYAAPSGALIFVNKRTADYLGVPKDHPQRSGIDIGAQWDDWVPLLHPDDQEEARKYWSNCLRTGEGGEHSYRVRNTQGDYRWFLTRFEPLRASGGNLLLWIGATLDIEELKRAEDRLRSSEGYLTEAQRLSHTGTWVLNPTTMQYFYWSDESYRIWAFDPLQGFPSRDALWQRIHPDDRDGVWEKVQEALRQKKDYSGEFRIVLPDGTVKYLAATCHHLLSTNGEIVKVIGTNVDVTERKRAEEARRQSEAKIRRLVDANIIGIFIWDLDGRIIEANDAFLRMVGYDHEDIVSGRMRWTELTPPEWRDPDVRRWLPELKMTGSLQPFEKEYFRKDGSCVPVLI